MHMGESPSKMCDSRPATALACDLAFEDYPASGNGAECPGHRRLVALGLKNRPVQASGVQPGLGATQEEILSVDKRNQTL